MRLRTKLCFGLSMVLFGLFLLGMSDAGQRYLIGTPSPDHWTYENQVIGADVDPIIVCLLPGIALFIASVILFFVDRRNKRKGQPSS